MPVWWKRPKPEKTYLANYEIRKMSYSEIGKALTSGQLTEKRLKQFYSQERKAALKAEKRIDASGEFAGREREHFPKLINLPTTSALAHEVADLNRYRRSARSTLSGLKKQREQALSQLHRHKMDFVTESNYSNWVRFMRWFKSSSYASFYDSNDDEVEEVFSSAENGSASDWAVMFDEIMGTEE